MRSTRTRTFSAIALSGAVLLAACSSPEPDPAQPVSAPSSASTQGRGAGNVPADLTTGTAKTSNAPEGTGDWAAPEGGTLTGAKAVAAEKWVQLTSARAGELDPVLVNGAGLTLYRFDEDSADPPTSTCAGECAETWPPVTVREGGKIFIAGVDKSKVGVVERADGKLQVTVGGWPVYRFAKDAEAGDTKGQGVKGTWFGLRPDGKKAGEQAGEQADGQADDQAGGQEGGQAGEQAGQEAGAEAGGQEAPERAQQESPPAKRVVLFGGRNFNVFDDAASSQVIEAGEVPEGGCVNAIDAATASSIAFDGLVKIWSGPDCTGDVQELGAVNAENVGGIADLRDIGFDNKIASVKIVS